MAILSLALAVVAALVDQLIKRLVVLQLKPVGSMTAIPGLLDFTYLENRGAAFGMLQDQRWFFYCYHRFHYDSIDCRFVCL